MTDELVRALLDEDAASARDIALALSASVARGVPLVRALLETRAASGSTLARVLARSEAQVVARVVPAMDLVAALPAGICERLHAVPLRKDPLTGTVDLALTDAGDRHAAAEMAYHLRAPVRVLRAPLLAMEEGLRRVLGITSQPPPVIAPFEVEAPPTPRRAVLVVADDDDDLSSIPAPASPPPSPASTAAVAGRRTRDTPPWGTQIQREVASEPPRSGMGSEIPIPLTRKTFTAVAGGTQRPPPLLDPTVSPLGEGYAFDAAGLGAVVEVGPLPAVPRPAPVPPVVMAPIPASEPAPSTERTSERLGLVAEGLAEARARVRDAVTRDAILDALLGGAARVAGRVALFVVRRGGYLGWTCTASFAARADLQALLLPLDAGNVLDRTVQEGLYLGPIPEDEAHAPLRALMRASSPDVAIVPVRVQERAAVLVLADDLVDTMLATRHLEDLAAAAGEAFARLLRG